MMPHQGRPLFDIGNPGLSPEVRSDLDIGKIPVPGGETGVATIRQGNVTMTLFLNRESAEQFGNMFLQLRDSLSGSGKLATAQAAPLVQAVPGQLR